MSQQVRLRPEQVVIVVVFEAQLQALQVAANQLGGFLKLTKAADALVAARQVLERALGDFQREWAGQVVVAQPADVPRVVAP